MYRQNPESGCFHIFLFYFSSINSLIFSLLDDIYMELSYTFRCNLSYFT